MENATARADTLSILPDNVLLVLTFLMASSSTASVQSVQQISSTTVIPAANALLVEFSRVAVASVNAKLTR